MPWLLVPIIQQAAIMGVLRESFSLFNALILAFVAVSMNQREVKIAVAAARLSLFLQIGVGYVQFLFSGSYGSNWIAALVPRSQAYLSLHEGLNSRGVSGLAPEPAIQATLIALTVAFLIYIREGYRFKDLIFDLVIISYLLLINRSLASVVCILIVYGSYWVIQLPTLLSKANQKSAVVAFFLVALVITVSPLDSLLDSSRALSIFKLISSPEKMSFVFFEATGHKVSSQAAVYASLSTFGFGFGGSAIAVATGMDYLLLSELQQLAHANLGRYSKV